MLIQLQQQDSGSLNGFLNQLSEQQSDLSAVGIRLFMTAQKRQHYLRIVSYIKEAVNREDRCIRPIDQLQPKSDHFDWFGLIDG